MKKGLWDAVAANFAWGFLPLYWKLLSSVPALQLLAHRIFWSFLFLLAWNFASHQWKFIKNTAITRRVIGIYSLASILIAITWLTFVWAVSAGHVIEVSLGHFINPLVSVFLGVMFMRERLRPLQWVPIGLATLGVFYLAIHSGSALWISLVLAFSFGLYGLVKKVSPLDSIPGLTIESGILFLPAIGILVYFEAYTPYASFNSNYWNSLALIGTGLATTIPLLWFSAAAKRIPLSTLGILQYIEPSLQFILGLLVFREPFSLDRLIGFMIVWAATFLFALEGLYSRHKEPNPVGLQDQRAVINQK